MPKIVEQVGAASPRLERVAGVCGHLNLIAAARTKGGRRAPLANNPQPDLTRTKSSLTSTLDTLKVIIGKRWPVILLFFVLEIALIVIVANSPFFPSELKAYETQYNGTKAVLNQSAQGQVLAIFANNFRVATVELVPIFGPTIFTLSIYETARIVEVAGIIQGTGTALALGTLFLLPSTWLELPAYAIAVAESMYLIYAIFVGFRRGWARLFKEMRYLVVNLMLIAVVLIVAATFEVTEIQIEQGPRATQPFALLTWIPFVGVFALGLMFWRRARREAPAIEEREITEEGGGQWPAPPVAPGQGPGEDSGAGAPPTS